MVKQKTVKTAKVFPLESFAIYGNICTHIHTYVDVLNQHVDSIIMSHLFCVDLNLWTMRFKAKHQYFKSLASRMGNFINITYSLAVWQ